MTSKTFPMLRSAPYFLRYLGGCKLPVRDFGNLDLRAYYSLVSQRHCFVVIVGPIEKPVETEDMVGFVVRQQRELQELMEVLAEAKRDVVRGLWTIQSDEVRPLARPYTF